MSLNTLVKTLCLGALIGGGLAACGADPDAELEQEYRKKVAETSVLGVLQSNPDLSALLNAVETTGLSDVLGDEGQVITLFAPSDEAFQALGGETLDALFGDVDTLADILTYHVIPEAETNAFSALGLAGKTLVSAKGDLVSLSRFEQNLFINGIAVTIFDLKATNGVVHIIDEVLLPPKNPSRDLETVKSEILSLAEQYIGITDDNFVLQRTFEPLLAELQTIAPQPPVASRIGQVAGAWQQIWGPYDYASGQEGVDPSLAPEEIYQVVFEDGYYYNVTPLLDPETGAERVGMLRGEFVFDADDSQCFQIQFVRFPGIDERPVGINLWELPLLQEAGTIETKTGGNTIEIVPDWIVKAFFSRGKLCEVYTDETMRISISQEEGEEDKRSLYIMTRVVE